RKSNRPQTVALETAHDEHHAVGGDGRRNRVHRDARALPEDLSGLEIVAAHLVHSRRNYLRATVLLDYERCGPRVDLLPIDAPDLVAALRVERDDERLTLMIPDDDEAVAVEHGRTALAELIAHLLVAEIFLPQELPVHVEDEHPLRLEPGVDALAVGD